MELKRKSKTGEKTVIKGTGFSAHSVGSHISAVDVRAGKILRIRPLHYDWKYKPEEFSPWKIEARGKVFEPPMKSMITPFGIGYKKRIYSPNRILYPLKRVDFDHKGERNTQNRGISKYVRISWDEALDIITSELKRVHKTYGPEAVYVQGEGHGESKTVHGTHGCSTLLLDHLGGYTQQIRNPDSWEGWYWGSKHVWGGEPVGMASEYQTNLYPDIARNTDMMLFWGCDPETTPWGFAGGQMTSRMCYWFTELGIRCIYICPEVNYAAAVHADKWIPVLPNTDAAMHLAIAYTWITEDTYDKKYIATHTVGFEKFKEYVLGKEDGIVKTPKWAEEKCGVPSRVIEDDNNSPWAGWSLYQGSVLPRAGPAGGCATGHAGVGQTGS
jgi:anaerobic selenocysteine-containing dehydrogenase